MKGCPQDTWKGCFRRVELKKPRMERGVGTGKDDGLATCDLPGSGSRQGGAG